VALVAEPRAEAGVQLVAQERESSQQAPRRWAGEPPQREAGVRAGEAAGDAQAPRLQALPLRVAVAVQASRPAEQLRAPGREPGGRAESAARVSASPVAGAAGWPERR